ncbi:hypothetical protein [Candidatus Endomicrobiellum agilis]|uniref:hypothetical protein n=1 Tax=Candidatus Endomicrobiellum agilis TaxID=3238957 RepID=UPI00357FDB70|nr:hypothetical protein [Endomicrobium sp.]
MMEKNERQNVKSAILHLKDMQYMKTILMKKMQIFTKEAQYSQIDSLLIFSLRKKIQAKSPKKVRLKEP